MFKYERLCPHWSVVHKYDLLTIFHRILCVLAIIARGEVSAAARPVLCSIFYSIILR